MSVSPASMVSRTGSSRASTPISAPRARRRRLSRTPRHSGPGAHGRAPGDDPERRIWGQALRPVSLGSPQPMSRTEAMTFAGRHSALPHRLVRARRQRITRRDECRLFGCETCFRNSIALVEAQTLRSFRRVRWMLAEELLVIGLLGGLAVGAVNSLTNHAEATGNLEPRRDLFLILGVAAFVWVVFGSGGWRACGSCCPSMGSRSTTSGRPIASSGGRSSRWSRGTTRVAGNGLAIRPRR